MNTFEKRKRSIRRKVGSRRVKFFSALTGIVAGLVLVFWGFYIISTWFNVNEVKFQAPIILKTPIIIQKRQPKIITKIKVVTMKKETEMEIISKSKHGAILAKIYQLESSSGRNDYCRIHELGFGGFGVMYNGQIICYPTFEKAVARADYWLTNLGVDKNVATALCTWNTGRPEINCKYYQSYISL